MENDANLEQMYNYPKQDDSNKLFKNCKEKRSKIQKAFSQTNETNTSKKLKVIFIVHKKEITTISKKRKKSRKIKRPRHKNKTINKRRHMIFHVSKTEKNYQQEKKCKKCPQPQTGVKFNKFKIKKIEHRKEKKYKTKEKQNTLNNNNSAKTEENYEKLNSDNLLYENNNYFDFCNQDETIGKETQELINTLSANRENFERPLNPNLENMSRPNRSNNIQPRTRAVTLVIKEIK